MDNGVSSRTILSISDNVDMLVMIDDDSETDDFVGMASSPSSSASTMCHDRVDFDSWIFS